MKEVQELKTQLNCKIAVTMNGECAEIYISGGGTKGNIAA